MNKNKSYEIDMSSGPILGKLLKFAVPLIFSSVLQLLFNAADIVVVGRFAGDNSLAAVGSTTSLINLLTNLFIGLSIGSNVIAAHYYGAHKQRHLNQTVHTSILLSLISGVVLSVAGFFLSRTLLELMQSPPEVLSLATVYLKIYFLGMTATMVYNFGSALLRAKGDTKRPLYFLLFAGVVNVILNLIFVIVFKMDVAGVALATVISQIISAGLVLRCLFLEEKGFKLYIGRLKINREIVFKILKVGLPAGFQGIVFSLSNVVIQSSVNSFGSIVIAGNSAASNLEGFVYVSMNAFHQAAITATSQTMGAGKKERLNSVVIISQVCVLCVGLLLGWSMLFLGPWLLQIYSSSAEVIDAGLNRISIIGPTYALCGMMDVMVGVLRGIGYSLLPMVVSLVGACGLRLLWIATVFQIPSLHTIIVLYISYPVSWVLTFLAHVSCFVWARKKLP